MSSAQEQAFDVVVLGAGSTGENVAEEFQVSRADQDAFAIRSQQRAGAAQVGDDGVVALGDEVALDAEPVGGRPAFLIRVGLDGDEHAGHGAGVLAARERRVHRRRADQPAEPEGDRLRGAPDAHAEPGAAFAVPAR